MVMSVGLDGLVCLRSPSATPTSGHAKGNVKAHKKPRPMGPVPVKMMQIVIIPTKVAETASVTSAMSALAKWIAIVGRAGFAQGQARCASANFVRLVRQTMIVCLGMFVASFRVVIPTLETAHLRAVARSVHLVQPNKIAALAISCASKVVANNSQRMLVRKRLVSLT